MFPFCNVTAVFRRINFFSILLFITLFPRNVYPDLRENVPGFNVVLLESKEDFGTVEFDLPSPKVAKATAERNNNAITVNFLPTILHIISFGRLIITKIKTKKNIKKPFIQKFNTSLT